MFYFEFSSYLTCCESILFLSELALCSDEETELSANVTVTVKNLYTQFSHGCVHLNAISRDIIIPPYAGL